MRPRANEPSRHTKSKLRTREWEPCARERGGLCERGGRPEPESGKPVRERAREREAYTRESVKPAREPGRGLLEVTRSHEKPGDPKSGRPVRAVEAYVQARARPARGHEISREAERSKEREACERERACGRSKPTCKPGRGLLEATRSREKPRDPKSGRPVRENVRAGGRSLRASQGVAC
ncbi:octapeptide-repeat protein T2-like [Dromiciops gliroides]|uniref:octapeptide-repeat protein T2-like n=1 Tax=Dromiciops gliroides TaxID=33562 RepID=UPI001CC4E789|nr:octapeptide-repeat protein T2-like [Dromiciops gliroides]